MINNFFVAQTSINDCGYACLAMIFKLNKIKFNDTSLKEELNRSKKGISAYDIVKTANKYGLKANGYKNFKITSSNLPLIAIEVSENNLQHFVVILKSNGNKFLVADPYLGIIKVEKEEFLKKYTGICITFSKKESLVKKILNNKMIIPVIILSIIIAFLSILFSYLLSLTLKMIEMGIDFSVMFKVLLIFLSIGIIKEIMVLIKNRLSLRFQLLMDNVITLPTIEKLLHLPYAFYNKNGSGELISKVNDLSHMKEMITVFVETLFVNIILIVLSVMVSIFVDYRLVFINFLVAIVLYVINKHFLNKHFYKTYDLQIKNEMLNNTMTDVFTGIFTIKNLVKEDYVTNKIKSLYKDTINYYRNLTVLFQNKEFIMSLFMVLLNVLLIVMLIIFKFSISKIVFVASLENLIIGSFTEIIRLQPLYFNFKSCYLRIKKIIDEDAEECTKKLTFIKNIQFKNVTYKYDEKTVLKNVSFEINNNDWIIITGPTGSGKSTLFKLLTKQINGPYDDIYLNDKCLSDIDDVRNSITYVDQKSKIFNWSIKENVAFDKNDFSLACKTAQVDNLFNYDYIIDNNDSNLSGGEKQKLIIARSLYNGSDILIFDETTSQLDSITERNILNNIKRNYPKKTIILITHHDKNADLFNKKIVIENGVIKN